MQAINEQARHYLPLVLISLIVSLLVMITYHFFVKAHAPRLVTVHLSDLINLRVKQFVKAKLPPEQLKNQMQIFARQLDISLKNLAREHHAVILVSEAVASGAEDVTGEMTSNLQQRKAL